MAKGYEETEQAFAEGDRALYIDAIGQTWNVKVLEVWQADDSDDFCYTVEYCERPDIEPFEVEQRYLELF